MRGQVLGLFAVAALAGCASMAPPPAGSDSSMILGRLKVEVSGMGTATNGASGWVDTEWPYAAALVVYNETNGRTYEIRTATPGDSFALANAEPGTYQLRELWAQVKTDDAYVTIRSSFYKDLAFEVKPGRLANLGVNSWKFSYDLTRAVSSNSFVLNADYPAAEQAQAGVDAQWTGRADETSFAGEAKANPSAVALQPRGTSNGQIIVVH